MTSSMSLARAAARHIPDSPWTACWDSPSDWLQKHRTTKIVNISYLKKKIIRDLVNLYIP